MHNPDKYKIHIINYGKIISSSPEDNLAEKILEAGINLRVDCNKKGLCGQCLVEIVKGKLPPLKPREELLFRGKGIKSNNYRLACLYKVKSNIELNILDESIVQEILILKTGIKSELAINPALKKYYLLLKKPQIGSPHSALDQWLENLQKKHLIINLDLVKKLPRILARTKFKVTTAIYQDEEILNVEPGHTVDEAYGIAIDVGTTTLVAALVDLNSGRSMEIVTSSNSQIQFGADVISRIFSAVSDSKNLLALKKAITNDLNKMIANLIYKNRINRKYIYEITIAANTTMNHLLLGIPVKTLAIAPFYAVFSKLPALSSREVGLKINKYGKVYFSPNIRSFVGGDISAGLLASDFENKPGNYLYLDLGTNGEIVLKTKDNLVTTSTAAGPAFEGMNISCGMPAMPGAIYKAAFDSKLILSTIKNKAARGICGTGLIDLTALFLEREIISSQGRIENKTKKIKITDKIYLSQKDIREIQLAVAAVKTGIKMILKRYNLKSKDLDGIFIAGAFGNYLNIKNSLKIGLLPEIDDDKITFIGNAALAGAQALLLSLPAREKIESLVDKIKYLSLATAPEFQGVFIESLEFKNWSI